MEMIVQPSWFVAFRMSPRGRESERCAGRQAAHQNHLQWVSTLDSTGVFNLITDDMQIQCAVAALSLFKTRYKTAAMNNPTNQA